MWLGPQLPRCSLLFSFTRKYSFTNKENKTKVFTSNEGNSVPIRTKISPTIQIYNIYNAWQSSLMLDGLSKALEVPIAREGSILGLALQP